MLIPLGEILNKYNIIPKGIIHCGAHYAEEHNDYVSYGIKDFVYIEPSKESFDIMCSKIFINDYSAENIKTNKQHYYTQGINVFNCACGREAKKMVMYVSKDNQGQSNSLLEPNLHIYQHPEVKFDDA